MALSKADLAENLFNTLGLNKREARELVEHFFQEICDALERGEVVKLSSFGNFTIRDKKRRPGRNPKTGKAVAVSERRVVSFRAGNKLKDRVENYARIEKEKAGQGSIEQNERISTDT